MSELHTYCVFFHPQALDVLGDAIAPYLTDGPHGKFVLCKEIDTGGSFCEMEITATNAEGKPFEVELMVPSGMIRLIISTSAAEIEFGFT
jgi:hypothetical protein